MYWVIHDVLSKTKWYALENKFIFCGIKFIVGMETDKLPGEKVS